MVGALKVMRNHETAYGAVTELLPHDHRTVVVTYEVGGQRYTTSTSLPDQLGLPPFERLRIGDKVRVEYDSTAPAIGILGSAEKLLLSDVKDIGFLGIFLLFVAASVEFNIRKYLMKSRGDLKGAGLPAP